MGMGLVKMDFFLMIRYRGDVTKLREKQEMQDESRRNFRKPEKTWKQQWIM